MLAHRPFYPSSEDSVSLPYFMEDSGVLTHLRQSPEHSTNTAVPEWGVLIVEQQVTWTEDGG